MAEVLDDGEFWLPPQFLTDDELFMDKNKAKSNPRNLEDGFAPFGLGLDGTTTKSLFPYGFPNVFGSLGFSSDPVSPVDSMVGSTETESDEEDYVAELTRQMAHSTLEDGILRNGIAFASEKPKGWGLSRSPQSTLCAVRRGCGCMQGSSRGSSTCQSRVSSPPGTWDLLYAAAGEVARMRMNEESYGGLNSNIGVLGSQFQILKQQQQQNLHHHNHNCVVQSRARSNNNNCSTKRPMSQSATWLPLQQQQQTQTQNGSGMRAVFLGNPTVKRQSTGTGVFLPRRIGAPTEPRMKPGCSIALLPARVVHALNLNLDEIGSR